MKEATDTKRIICILLYATVLYYLLPFNPAALYYYEHHESANLADEITKTHPAGSTICLADNSQHLHKKSKILRKKDRVSFVAENHVVPELQHRTTVPLAHDEIHYAYQLSNSTSPYSSHSGRSPPSV